MPHAKGPPSIPSVRPDRQDLSPVEEKALRMIAEGRVHVTWANEDSSAASGIVDGDTGTWHCSFSPAGRICTCPAGSHHRRCAHPMALELLVSAGLLIELQLEL